MFYWSSIFITITSHVHSILHTHTHTHTHTYIYCAQLQFHINGAENWKA